MIKFHDEGQHTGTDAGDFTAVSGTLPELLDHVTITGKRDDVTFTVEPRSRSEIVVMDPDNSARGAAHAIQSLCRKRRRRLRSALPPADGRAFPPMVASVAFGVSIVPVSLAGVNLRGWLFWFVLTVIALLIATAVGAILLLTSTTTTMINAPRAQRPTHWQRHRILYISNMVTLILGGLIGYWVEQLPPWK